MSPERSLEVHFLTDRKKKHKNNWLKKKVRKLSAQNFQLYMLTHVKLWRKFENDNSEEMSGFNWM